MFSCRPATSLYLSHSITTLPFSHSIPHNTLTLFHHSHSLTHRDEKITALAFLITVGLWIGGASLGVNSVAAATVGLAILLITGK